MRKSFLLIGLIIALELSLSAQGGTLFMVAKISPADQGISIPESSLRPLTDQIESAVLDQCFEWGFIISTFPPLLCVESAGLDTKSAEIINLVYQAREASANWLVLVTMETGPLPAKGLPQIITVRLEVHDMAAGLVKTGAVRISSTTPAEIGKEIGKHLHAFL